MTTVPSKMVGKRKEHPVVQASAAKRRGEEEEEVEEDIPWGTKAGMILEVSMRNFMCHQVHYSSGFLLKLVHVSTLDLHLQA